MRLHVSYKQQRTEMTQLDKWKSLASLPKQEPSGRWVDQGNNDAPFDPYWDYFEDKPLGDPDEPAEPPEVPSQ